MSTTTRTRAARQSGTGDIRRSVLPSGLRVVTEHMPASQTFAIGFFVDVGSRHEGDTVLGAAHYLEHVLFKGTSTRSAEQISAAFDAIGGDANAYTSKEHTCFYTKVLADDAPIAVEVLLDMLTHSLIRPEDVDAEREVILDEIAMHSDDALETAYSLMSERLYPERLGRDVIGTKESIRAMTRAQVRSFWRRHYVPGNIVVSAAGNVDHAWLVRQLSGWSGEPVERRTAPAGKRRDLSAVAVRRKEQEQAACVLGFAGLARDDTRRYAAELLATALGGGMSARLFLEVREFRGLAYHIDASAYSYSDAGQFQIEWLSSPARVPEILDVVGDVCADVVRNGVTDDELVRIKGQVRGQLLLGYDAPEARMMRHGRRELSHDPRTLAQVLAGYERVTAAQIRDIAGELLRQRPYLAVVGGTVERRPLERRIDGWSAHMQGAIG